MTAIGFQSSSGFDDRDPLTRRAVETTLQFVRRLPSSQRNKLLSVADPVSFLAGLIEHAPEWAAPGELLPREVAASIGWRRQLEGEAGGLLSASAAAQALGLKSPQAVHKMRAERRILAVEMGERHGYPACQFQLGRILAGLADIIAAAPTRDGWTILDYLLSRPEGLGGARPLDLLRSSKAEDRERATRFAHRLED